MMGRNKPAPKPVAKPERKKDDTAQSRAAERARVKGIMSLPGDPSKLDWLAYATDVTVADAKAILEKDAEAGTESETDDASAAWITSCYERAKGRSGVTQ
jgi:hypothetical protein